MKKVKDKTEQCCKKALVNKSLSTFAFKIIRFCENCECLVFMQIAYKQFSAQIK